MLQELLRQVEAADIFKAGIVFHAFRQVDLAAGQALFDQHGLECRPHGIEPGRETAGTAADNHQIKEFSLRHHQGPPDNILIYIYMLIRMALSRKNRQVLALLGQNNLSFQPAITPKDLY